MRHAHKMHGRICKGVREALVPMQQLTLAVMVAILVLPLNAFAQGTPTREGDLDTSFGGDGKVLTDIGARVTPFAVAIQPDRKIVVGGTVLINSIHHLILVRYLPNGTLDTSFNVDGKVISDFDFFTSGAALALQPDGKIVVAGSADLDDFLVVRYLPNGKLDNTFNGKGWVTTNLLDNDVAHAMTLQPDGKIVVAGRSNAEFAVARYLSHGTLDNAFSGNGWVTTSLGDGSTATAVVLEPNGKILVAGVTNIFTETDIGLARYLPNGQLDTSFSGNGWLTTDLASVTKPAQ